MESESSAAPRRPWCTTRVDSLPTASIENLSEAALSRPEARRSPSAEVAPEPATCEAMRADLPSSASEKGCACSIPGGQG